MRTFSWIGFINSPTTKKWGVVDLEKALCILERERQLRLHAAQTLDDWSIADSLAEAISVVLAYYMQDSSTLLGNAHKQRKKDKG